MHFYTATVGEVFFEVVQRHGGYDGYPRGRQRARPAGGAARSWAVSTPERDDYRWSSQRRITTGGYSPPPAVIERVAVAWPVCYLSIRRRKSIVRSSASAAAAGAPRHIWSDPA